MSEEKKGFWSRLVSGLSKTRDNIVSGIDAVFNGFSNIDDDFYEEIEEILIEEKSKGKSYQRSGRVQGTSDQQYQRADGCRRDSLSF